MPKPYPRYTTTLDPDKDLESNRKRIVAHLVLTRGLCGFGHYYCWACPVLLDLGRAYPEADKCLDISVVEVYKRVLVWIKSTGSSVEDYEKK